MNPIAKMMKRHIKTPLKYALPLLFVFAILLVSIAGCTTQESTSTAGNAKSGGGSNNQAASISATANKVALPSLSYNFRRR